MATLTNTKIKDTYDSLLKISDNGIVEATEQVVTDGLGNNTTLSIGTASASVAGTLSFGSLKDSGENITITKFVDEADGIASNDNDTTIPTSAAVKNYVDSSVPTESDTLATVTARGSSTNTAITVQGLRLSTGANSAGIVLGNPTALLDNTTGESNIAIGEFGTLADNTTGSNNIALGSLALDANTTGSNNTAIGISALTNNITGNFNTAIGSSALRNINGSGNFAMGYNAGANIDALPSEKTGGSDNIYIGSESKSGAISTDNEIVIGSNAVGNGSNTATYGNSSIVEHHFTAGDVYMNADLFGLEVIGNSFGPTEYIRLTGGELNFGTSGGDKVTIDSSGNVGIGSSNPTISAGGGIVIDKTISTLSLQNGTGSTEAFDFVKAGNDGYLILRDNGNIRFSTNDIERMRITSGGEVLFGTTGVPNGTSVYGSAFTPTTNDRSLLRMASSSTGSSTLAVFYNPNGSVGSIVASGSATAYNTSSDYRLKEDWQPIANALDRVDDLNPVNFAWKVDGSRVDGFLAHELAEVVPEAVTGEKDAVDEEGNPIYQGIDQSKITPLLTAAIKELKAIVDAQAEKIAILESKLNA